jgi:hypothetical protein
MLTNCLKLKRNACSEEPTTVASGSGGISDHSAYHLVVHELTAPFWKTSLDPTNVTKAAVRDCLEGLRVTYLMNRTDAIKKQFEQMRTLRDMMNKYPIHQREYDTYMQGNPTGNRRHLSPLLLDVLCSGLTYSACATFGDEQAADVRTLLKILPSCASSRFGLWRSRTKLFPLFIACMNEQVGLDVVRMLIEAKGSVNRQSTIRFDGQDVRILVDAKSVVSESRFKQLDALFAEYE